MDNDGFGSMGVYDCVAIVVDLFAVEGVVVFEEVVYLDASHVNNKYYWTQSNFDYRQIKIMDRLA